MEKAYQHLKQKKLAFFFTYGLSLAAWKNAGMLDRELKMYKELGTHFEKIYFITYGDSDATFEHALAPYNIEILYKQKKMFNFLYSLYIPFIFKKQLCACDYFKTNQMLGSWTAVIAKILYKKVLLLRTGYTLSIFSKRTSQIKYFLSKIIEFFALRVADHIIVATDMEKDYFKACKDNISVIPNYVDTDEFTHMPKQTKSSSNMTFLCIGRLHEQKNLDKLICALQGMPGITLQLIGQGHLRSSLERLAKQMNVTVQFLGNKPHKELPKYINQADMFIFPSLYEGNPKVLLEAMSCGVPIITTNVEGIRTIVEHKKTAYLCETDVTSLRYAIQHVMADVALQKSMGENARDVILKKYSLKHIIQRELLLYV